jgi:hypothetical protein
MRRNSRGAPAEIQTRTASSEPETTRSNRYAVAGQVEYGQKNEGFTFHRGTAEVPFFLLK